MATITSLGVGSGLDINSIVQQLVAVESRPLAQLRSQASSLQTQVSSYGKLSSLLGTLQTAAGKLNGGALWAQSTASSSNAAAASVVGSGSAVAGRYAVTVQALASSQTVALATPLTAATETVGSGTLSLQLGSWDSGQTAFTAKAGASPVTLAVSPSDTLQTLRDKINGLDAGVTASVVTDASGVRLALRSTETGAENGFQITALDDDGNGADAAGLSRFAFDPPGGTTAMALKQPGADALATVNGVDVRSAGNDLSTVVEGLTITLHKQSAEPVDITVVSDREGLKTAIKSFAEAYNGLATAIADLTKYDATSKTAGALQGDSAATSLQRQLRAVLNTPTGASTVFANLSDMGLSVQRDGTLSVDSAKLDAAVANPAELRKALTQLDTQNPANVGFARRYANLATSVLGVDGTLTTRTEGLQDSLTRNSTQQERFNDHIASYQARLVAQYTAMDGNLAKLNALSSFVSQQLTALTNASSNG